MMQQGLSRAGIWRWYWVYNWRRPYRTL